MVIGVVKEIKPYENRVALLPVGVESLVRLGHEVLVEREAGVRSGFSDECYEQCGATILDLPNEVFDVADMILKVKEPQPEEYVMIREGQIVFTYFHFASSRSLTECICKTGCIAIAYETVEDLRGGLPLLTPMSEIAGRMSIQQGGRYLQREKGGKGILMGGVPGVAPATVMILGGGAVGTNAAYMAAGLGSNTYVLDVNVDRLRYLSEIMPANVTTLMSNTHTIRELVQRADLIINGVLIKGDKAPKLIDRETLRTMPPGSVVVDVAIDQGGGLETSRPTTHMDPTYVEEGVVHYCVTNMPGAVPVTSTIALTNVTLPYILALAQRGIKALLDDTGFAKGVNMMYGHITHPAVAKSHELEYVPLESVLRTI